MGIFNSDKFDVFKVMLDNINDEYKKILDNTFNNNISEYISHNKYDPYGVSVSMQGVIDIVDSDFLDIISDIDTIFGSVSELDDTMDKFVDYYSHLSSIASKSDLTKEDMTWVVALDLIFIHKNTKNNSIKKVSSILRSMCNFPNLGVLVQLTNSVLR